MIRHILKQIWTQRRRNTWIFAELFIIFILAWYIIDYGFVLMHNRLIPKGFEVENTYRVSYKELTNDAEKAVFRSFYDKVRLYPGVEKTFLTYKYSGVTPYNGSYSSSSIKRDTTKTSKDFYAQIKPLTSNSYFEIFQVHSAVKPDAFGQIDFSKKSIALTKILADAMFKNETPIGKKVFINGKEEYIVTDVINNQKRFTYDVQDNVIFYPTSDTTITMPEIALKTGPAFSLEQFKKDISNSITSYEAVKERQELMDGSTTEINIRFGIMIFFLLNVSLGIIGTFWFRNQKRRGEIGLRMALGSTRAKLQRQYILEALLLLTLAVVPALCVNAALAHYDVIQTPGNTNADISAYITANKWLRFIITNSLTYLLLAAIVALSAWIPAHKASKIHPVDALRDE